MDNEKGKLSVNCYPLFEKTQKSNVLRHAKWTKPK